MNLEAGCTSRLLRKPQNPHELLGAPASTTRGCWHQEDKEDGNLVLRWPHTRLPDPCETPTQPQKTHQNLLKNNQKALAGHSGNNILNSPLASVAAAATASSTSTAAASAAANHVGQRLLPYVPKRFVVPRVSAKELLHTKDSRAALGHAQHRALFEEEEDENNAVTHLGGLQRYLL